MNLQTIKDRLALPGVYEVSMSEVRWLVEQLDAAEKRAHDWEEICRHLKAGRLEAAERAIDAMMRCHLADINKTMEAAIAGKEKVDPLRTRMETAARAVRAALAGEEKPLTDEEAAHLRWGPRY